MKHQDVVSMLITFVVGLLVGSYLYVTGFATTFSISTVANSSAYDEMVITGDSYGACADTNSCLTFQVVGDGSYRAIYDATGARVVSEGTLPRAVRRQFGALTASGLAADAVPLSVPQCAYEGETNYRFTITLEGVVYRLDTCRTDIAYDGPVWSTMKSVWAALATP